MSSSGWVKMKDPNTGMDYYANRITRQTQWEVPTGFVDESNKDHNVTNDGGSITNNNTRYDVSSSGFGSFNNSNGSMVGNTDVTTNSHSYSNGNSHNHWVNHHDSNGSTSYTNGHAKDDTLPPNWEQLYDKSSGKYFYVDHESKITTWERPVAQTKKKEGMATGFGMIPKEALNRNTNQLSTPISAKKANGYNGYQSHSTTSATSPTWQYFGSNPPPSTVTSPMSKFHSSSSLSAAHHDDVSTKYYHENKIDFTVQKVPDRLRVACPSCDVIFSMPLKRRHHCRVCQDVFCDTCSNTRVDLPFDGEEFSKPVRVCDMCHLDVEHGNFFSMRRYLTPLQLYDGEDINEGGVKFSSKNVCAALCGLSQDLQSLLLDSTSFTEKVTIPAEILVPAICRHLKSQETCAYAIKALSTLIALGNVVGEHKFLMEVYTQKYDALEDIMNLLEWSGSSSKTLAVQEQTAQTLFYLTDSKIVAEILRVGESRGDTWCDAILSRLDVHRALRSTLDHTTQAMSPSLQRWSAACICNLIAEDYRKSCESINYAMTMGSSELKHESFISEMVTSGGVMILSSLVSSDDADTRNYAMKALSATIELSREVNIQLSVLKEAYGIDSINGSNHSDASIIDGIVSTGVCGPLTQLLLSADDTVATMGCSFARSLVHPLLTNPLGSALPCYHRLLSVNSSRAITDSISENGLGTYRKAALQLALSDGILSALVHLISDNMTSSRPIDLRLSAMEILAAITLTLSFLSSKVQSMGASIDGIDEWEKLKHDLNVAFVILEEEKIGEATVLAFSSSSVSSLNTSRDSTASQLREAASLIISATASSSSSIASQFVSCNIVAKLISTATDNGYATASARGEWTSRRLAMLEAIAMILVHGWKDIQVQSYEVDQITNNNLQSGNSAPLELLLEALDAGIIPLVSRLLDTRIEQDTEKSYQDVRLKISLCHIIGALFGIGHCDQSNIGFARIFEAIGNTHYLIPMTVALLTSSINAVQHYMAGTQTHLPIPSLLEANLLALGSMCGSRFCSFSSEGKDGDKAVLHLDIISPQEKDVFSCQFEEICMSTCEIIVKHSFLTSSLVGAFGEQCIMPTLRVASAIAENGPEKTHGMLANSGILLPAADMLRDALVAGDYYVFDTCVTLISICGSQLNSNSENSGIQSLRGCVKMLANVLTIDEGEGRDTSQTTVLSSLKRKCVFAIDRLSNNAGLWVTIVQYFIPCVSEYLVAKTASNHSSEDIAALLAGLRVILRVISLPAHAFSIAQSSIAASLSRFIGDIDIESSIYGALCEVETLSLQILNNLCSVTIGKQAKTELLEIEAVNAACNVLCRDIKVNSTSDYASKMKNALEIIITIVLDLESIEDSMLSTSSRIFTFIETVGMHPDFIKRLCATLLHLGDLNEKSSQFKVEPMYGPTIVMFEGHCGGFERSTDAAIYLFYRIAFFCTLVDTTYREEFWHIFFLEDETNSNDRLKTTTFTATSAIFLNILNNEVSGVCLPVNKEKLNYFKSKSLPLVRGRLLVGLREGIDDFVSGKISDIETIAFRNLLESYKIPQSCLGLCNSPLLLDRAFQVLEIILSEFSDVLVESIVTDTFSLTSLFNLLSTNHKDDSIRTKPEMIRIFAAVTLSAAGKQKLLGSAVKESGLRSLAIASLSTACLMEEQDSIECIAEDLTGDGASISTLCLRAIVDILSEGEENISSSLQMSPSEAMAISSALGKKLSTMVLEHFVRCESGECSIEEKENVGLLPEVMIICALATFQESLVTLCNVGGLEALSLIASEGIESAINALHHACEINSELVLKVDGHVSVMQVIAYHSDDVSVPVKEACMDFLATICTKSKTAKTEISVANETSACIEIACGCILSHSKRITDIPQLASTGDLLDSIVDTPKDTDAIEIDDINLVLSCLSFLSSITRVKSTRKLIIQDLNLKESLSTILENTPSYAVKYAVNYFCATLARYISDFDQEGSRYSIPILSSMLLKCFTTQRARHKPTESTSLLYGNFSKIHNCNDNLVLATACSAFEHMLPYMSTELVDEVLITLSSKFSEMVKYEMRTAKRVAMKTRNSGLLASNLVLFLFLCSVRSEYKTSLRKQQIISDLMCLILLNPGDNLSEGKKDNEDDIRVLRIEKTNWNCGVMYCLQCLATLSIELDDVHSWDEIISSVELEVQQTVKFRRSNRTIGTSTSKETIPSNSLLETLNKCIGDSVDSGSSIAAKKIIENLDLGL